MTVRFIIDETKNKTPSGKALVGGHPREVTHNEPPECRWLVRGSLGAVSTIHGTQGVPRGSLTEQPLLRMVCRPLPSHQYGSRELGWSTSILRWTMHTVKRS